MKIPAAVAAAAAAVEDKPREKKAYAPLPDGRYPARLIDITPGETSNGNIKATLKFEVSAGDPNAGRWLFRDLVFTEKAAGIVKSVVVDGLGLDLTDDLSLALGREVSLVVGLRSYTANDGELKTVNEVKFVNAPRAGTATPAASTTPVEPLF